MKHMSSGYPLMETSPALLEDPRIAYPRRRTIGRYVDILYDQWFKSILGAEGNEDVILAILRELIPERTIVTVRLDKRKRRKVNPFVDGHDAYFDIECMEADGTRFVVEMQKTEQVNFPERALFYSTFPIQEQVEAEHKRMKLRRSHDKQYDYPPVFIISFLNFSLHEGSDRVLFRYDLRERESGDLMTDRINYIFLEMRNFTREEILPQDSFAQKISYAFTHMGALKERPAALMEKVFEKLFEACEIKRLPEQELTKYKETMTTAMDLENILYTAEVKGEMRGERKGLKKGLKKGLQKGMEKGIEKGIEKGMEKGMENGARKALIATARRMVGQLGYSPQQAAEATGLPLQDFMEK